MKNNYNHKAKLIRLFIKHEARCCYCNRLCTLSYTHKKGQTIPKNAATIEHVYPKSDIRRYAYHKGFEQPVKLACYKCNLKKGTEDGRILNQPAPLKYYDIFSLIKQQSMEQKTTITEFLSQGREFTTIEPKLPLKYLSPFKDSGSYVKHIFTGFNDVGNQFIVCVDDLGKGYVLSYNTRLPSVAIVPAPIVKEGWYNVYYTEATERIYIAEVYPTEEKAMAHKNSSNYIRTEKITIEI